MIPRPQKGHTLRLVGAGGMEGRRLVGRGGLNQSVGEECSSTSFLAL